MSNLRPTLAVKGKWVLIPDGDETVFGSEQWVLIENDKITAVSPNRPAEADDFIELDEALVLPGFINMHNHISSAVLTRGLTEDLPTQSYASELIYDILMPTSKVAVETLEDSEIRAIADLGMLEIIKGGTTTLLDMFRSQQTQIFESAAEMGLPTPISPPEGVAGIPFSVSLSQKPSSTSLGACPLSASSNPSRW